MFAAKVLIPTQDFSTHYARARDRFSPTVIITKV